jgi:hypothetical protein
VIIYSIASLIPFTALSLLNSGDIELFMSSFIIVYFFLRLALNPKMRTKIDIMSIVLFAVFALLIAQRLFTILQP